MANQFWRPHGRSNDWEETGALVASIHAKLHIDALQMDDFNWRRTQHRGGLKSLSWGSTSSKFEREGMEGEVEGRKIHGAFS